MTATPAPGARPVAAYHVSPHWNRNGILEVGIDPMKSRGKRKVSWFAGYDALAWVLAHTSMKYHLSVDELDVWDCDLPAFFVKQTRWKAVYTCGMIVVPKLHRSPGIVLAPDLYN